MFFLFAGKLYILEVNKIFCAISLLEFVSNRLVSKRLCIETTGFRFERTNPSDPHDHCLKKTLSKKCRSQSLKTHAKWQIEAVRVVAEVIFIILTFVPSEQYLFLNETAESG